MIRTFILAMTLATASSLAAGQNAQLHFDESVCSFRYNVTASSSASKQSFKADAKFDEEILEIVYYAGLQPDFIMVEIDQENAFALIEDQIRYIAYGGAFLSSMERTTNTKWASYSIMAHEMGHHYQGHTIKTGGSSQPGELEADEYSGFILSQMGATVEQATATMAHLAPETVPADSSHPARAERLAAISKGWVRGQKLIKEQADRYNERNPQTVSRPTRRKTPGTDSNTDSSKGPSQPPQRDRDDPAPADGISRVWAVDGGAQDSKSRDPETFKFVRDNDRLTVAAISPSGEVYLYRGDIQDGVFTVTAETEKVIRRGTSVKIKDVLSGEVDSRGRSIAVSRRYFMDDQLVANSSWNLKPYRKR